MLNTIQIEVLNWVDLALDLLHTVTGAASSGEAWLCCVSAVRAVFRMLRANYRTYRDKKKKKEMLMIKIVRGERETNLSNQIVITITDKR